MSICVTNHHHNVNRHCSVNMHYQNVSIFQCMFTNHNSVNTPSECQHAVETLAKQSSYDHQICFFLKQLSASMLCKCAPPPFFFLMKCSTISSCAPENLGTHTHTHIHICTHTHKHTYTHTNTHTHTHTHTHTRSYDFFHSTSSVA